MNAARTPMRLHTIVFAALLWPLIAPAADVGECAAPEAMTARLKAEDQHSVVTADVITAERQLFALIVTMSTDRKTGYILKADQPLGDRASQFCIYSRIANVRLFDARRPGLLPAVLLSAPEADAARRCAAFTGAQKIDSGLCVPLNARLRTAEASGERVALQGFITAKGPDGNHKPNGQLLTLSGYVGGSVNTDPDRPERGILGHILSSSLPDGAPVQKATLVYVDYTPQGLAALQ